MTETNTPHDGFFKRFFGDLAIAREFMERYLPPEIVARLDLTTLKIENESFVDPDLRKHFSDLLFSVQTTAQEAVFIYLLLEHKSSPERWVAFQLLRYIVRFWERLHAQGHERLPLVIPIVFYHGQERWNVPRRLGALFTPREFTELYKYAPELEYDLQDVSVSGGREIAGSPVLRAGLQMLRYIFSEDLEQRLKDIFRNLREVGRAEALQYLQPLLAYLSAVRKKINKQKVREAMAEVFTPPQLEFDKSALFIQEWMEEGREEGIQIGEHKGLYALTLRQLQHRLGPLDEPMQEQVRALPNQKLEDLGVALLDFTSSNDLQQWLNENAAKPVEQ